MKVLHIGKFYSPFNGGIEKVNFDCVESLNKSGIETDIICFNHEKGTSVESKDYTIYRCSTLVSAFSTPISFSFYKILRKIHSNYDIIHIHLPNPFAAISLQMIGYKGKLVLHWHCDIVKQKTLKLFYNIFQKKTLEKADRIIVTSPNYLYCSADLKPFQEKCAVIPIGISSSEKVTNEYFDEILKKRYENKKVILSIGRLVYYKGFEYLIRAAKDLDSKSVIIIGGTGPLEEKLKSIILEHKLESKVELIGKIDEDKISSYYKRADLFCLASNEKSEAFGVVLIEALSFSIPLITADILGSGVSWVNQHGLTGLVVPTHSSEAIGIAINQILSNHDLYQEYKLNAKTRFENDFTLSKMNNSLINLYNLIASERINSH